MKWILLLVFILPNNESIEIQKIEFETNSLCEAVAEEFRLHNISGQATKDAKPRTIIIHSHCFRVRE